MNQLVQRAVNRAKFLSAIQFENHLTVGERFSVAAQNLGILTENDESLFRNRARATIRGRPKRKSNGITRQLVDRVKDRAKFLANLNFEQHLHQGQRVSEQVQRLGFLTENNELSFRRNARTLTSTSADALLHAGGPALKPDLEAKTDGEHKLDVLLGTEQKLETAGPSTINIHPASLKKCKGRDHMYSDQQAIQYFNSLYDSHKTT